MWIFLHKQPKSVEIISVVLIVLGLIGISLCGFRGKNTFDALGISAVIGALYFDAVASNMEDKVMLHHGASQSELISMIYTMGAVAIGAVSVLSSMRCLPSATRRSDQQWLGAESDHGHEMRGRFDTN